TIERRTNKFGLIELLRNEAVVDCDLPGLRIDVFVDRLMGGLAFPQEFAGAPVERPDDAALADSQEHLPGMTVDLDIGELRPETMIEIPTIPRQELVVPDDLAGVGIKRQCRVGIEDSAVAGAAHDLAVRDRAAGAPIDEIERRIVTAGGPDRA